MVNAKMYVIQSDFLADWYGHLKSTMVAHGFEVPDDLNGERLAFTYFNARNRGVPAIPRRVRVAAGVVCLSENLVGFEALKAKIERGDDLLPHLSTSAFDLEKCDGLLNDWGVYHLHLGTEAHEKRSGFVNRTQNLVFAIFNSDEALILGIHPHSPSPWTKTELMTLLNQNWPEFIEPLRLRGVTPDNLSDEQRAVLRAKGGNAALSIGDAAYAPPGGGLTGGGTRMLDVRDADYYAYVIQEREKLVRKEFPRIVQEKGVAAPTPTTISLKIEDGRSVAYADTTPVLRMDLGVLE